MRAKHAHALLAFVLGLLLLLTVLTAWARWEVGEAPGDFRCFDGAATRWLAGEPLYVREHDHFDSPPPFIWLTLPAHALGPVGGHAFAMFAGLALAGAALALVRRSLTPAPSVALTLAFATYLPLWLSASIAQWGGAFFAVFAATFHLATRGRRAEAGVCASLLLAKPTLALFVVPVVALGLGRRAAAGLLAGAVVFFVASVPLGLQVWPAWLDQLRWASEAHAAAEFRWQHHTLLGTLRAAAASLDLDPRLALGVWALLAAPLGATTIVFASRLLRAGDALRSFSLLALATIALNLYVRYYDSLAVLLPALALASRPGRSRTQWALALAYLVVASLDAAWLQGQVPIPPEGLLLTAWLVVALLQARAGKHAKAAPAPPVSRSIPDLP